MGNFTEAEIAYLKSQRLGRLATVNAQGEPHVVPVGFRYNDGLETIDIGGHGLASSRKYRDAQRGGTVAFVVDDVLPPWQPRGIEVRGPAEALASGGEAFGPGYDAALIRIRPRRIIGWGIETERGHPNSRTVE